MASKAAAQIRQGSVGRGQQQGKRKEWGRDGEKPKKRGRGKAGSQPKWGDKQQNAVEDQACRQVVRT